MLELPEALVLAGQINERARGRRVVRAEAGGTPHRFAFFQGEPAWYPRLLEGRRLEEAQAYGGRVELRLEDSRLDLSDGVNLRWLAPGARRPDRHQLLLELDDGAALVASVQMYGALLAFPAGAIDDNFYYRVAREKPSPLSGDFDESYFGGLWAQARPGLSAKAFLAAEQRIPGLGNGCLQDVLFRAGVHPKRRLETLRETERTRLFHSVKNTLREMADQGGRDTEKDLMGQSGGYQTYLSAKTWRGACPFCGGAIIRQAYLGGNVYFCIRCQPLEG